MIGVFWTFSLILLLGETGAFTVVPVSFLCPSAKEQASSRSSPAARSTAGSSNGLFPLFMGRAAAVRANTKAKTDMKKAKTNAIYGKKIIVSIIVIIGTFSFSTATRTHHTQLTFPIFPLDGSQTRW